MAMAMAQPVSPYCARSYHRAFSTLDLRRVLFCLTTDRVPVAKQDQLVLLDWQGRVKSCFLLSKTIPLLVHGRLFFQ